MNYSLVSVFFVLLQKADETEVSTAREQNMEDDDEIEGKQLLCSAL